MVEEWKDVVGYEGYYKISNFGRLKSVTRNIDHGVKESKRVVKGKEKKLCINPAGYYITGIYKDGRYKNCKIHRLVAEAFIPNPYNKPEVNHIDCNTLNNNVENLEWVTHKENMIHASQHGRMDVPEESKKLIGLKTREKYSIPVVGTNVKTGEVFFFKSMSEAKELGFYSGNISQCCLGKRHTHRGYKWRRTNPSELGIETITENQKLEMISEWGKK